MKTFALAGNPNCGKTTLFNALTLSSAHVGNWAGVTVDKREGVYKKGKLRINIVDLPGIYSLSPYTPEEVIARNFILDGESDGIINIVDATNLERNLYLTTQLLEMDVPVIVALNMIDEVERSHDVIDCALLSDKLGVPVVPISALNGDGISTLMEQAVALKERKGKSVLWHALADKIAEAEKFFAGEKSPLFHAIKLLEKDELELSKQGAKAEAERLCAGADLEAVIADERYKYISKELSCAKKCAKREGESKSDKIDKVLTHKIWALPIFAVILFFIFHLTFSENLFYLNGFTEGQAWMPTLEELGLTDADGEYKNFGVELLATVYDGTIYSFGLILTNILNLVLDHVTDGVMQLMQNGASEFSVGLVCDGILGGIFSVLGFLPQILVLFLFFSVLEDTGYMARIAFVLDRIFRRFGLSGRAFMPMIMGFGCSVAAAVNTRTLADEKERTATIRVIPFFSCGAKLPILTAVAGGIAAALGAGNVEVITFGMYVLGICTAIACVLIMRSTTLKGDVPPFIMELPTYHAPKFKNLMIRLWDKTKHFIKKAFTIIFVSTVIIWMLSHLSFTWHYLPDEEMQDSVLASLGKLIQPIFTPLGFGSQLGEFGWVFAVAAITGLIAKENVISTFTTLAICLSAYAGAGSEDGVEELSSIITLISQNTGMGRVEFTSALLAFIAFNMTTIPCFAACATAKAELEKGKFKYTICFWLTTSFVVASMIYTIGSWWWTLFIWLVVWGVVITLIIFQNKINLKAIFKRRGK